MDYSDDEEERRTKKNIDKHKRSCKQRPKESLSDATVVSSQGYLSPLTSGQEQCIKLYNSQTTLMHPMNYNAQLTLRQPAQYPINRGYPYVWNREKIIPIYRVSSEPYVIGDTVSHICRYPAQSVQSKYLQPQFIHSTHPQLQPVQRKGTRSLDPRIENRIKRSTQNDSYKKI